MLKILKRSLHRLLFYNSDTNDINSVIQFWAGKISNNKALIAVTSCSNYKINNAVSVYSIKTKCYIISFKYNITLLLNYYVVSPSD